MFPKLIIADAHVHERRDRIRCTELIHLLRKLEILFVREKCKSFDVLGDLIDRNTPLSVNVILQLGEFMQKMGNVTLLVGNHDTPVKHRGHTLLDLFQLTGAKIISEPTVKNNCLYLPYYTSEFPKASYSCAFMHKDIKELNPYFDEDWVIGLKDLPNAKTVFNGHLHSNQEIPIHNGKGTLVQLGAPYPTTWGDSWQTNRFAYVVDFDGSYKKFCLNITIDEGAKSDQKFSRIRERAEEAVKLDDSVSISMEDFREDVLDVTACLKLIDADRIAKRIAQGVIEHATIAQVKSNEL